MSALEKYEAAIAALKGLVAAEKASIKACEARGSAPAGVSRADDYYGEFPSGHKWNQILIIRERP